MEKKNYITRRKKKSNICVFTLYSNLTTKIFNENKNKMLLNK